MPMNTSNPNVSYVMGGLYQNEKQLLAELIDLTMGEIVTKLRNQGYSFRELMRCYNIINSTDRPHLTAFGVRLAWACKTYVDQYSAEMARQETDRRNDLSWVELNNLSRTQIHQYVQTTTYSVDVSTMSTQGTIEF